MSGLAGTGPIKAVEVPTVFADFDDYWRPFLRLFTIWEIAHRASSITRQASVALLAVSTLTGFSGRHRGSHASSTPQSAVSQDARHPYRGRCAGISTIRVEGFQELSDVRFAG